MLVLQFSCKKHVIFVMSEGLNLMLSISRKASKCKITNGQSDIGSSVVILVVMKNSRRLPTCSSLESDSNSLKGVELVAKGVKILLVLLG